VLLLNIEEVLRIVRGRDVRWIELQFTDLEGRLRSVILSAKRLSTESFSRGFGKLDGSSVKGFKNIEESDLVLVPIPETFAILPWSYDGGTTARFISKIYDTYGGGRFIKDPRYVAERALSLAKNEGYMPYFGPEVEFFIFDHVSVDISRPYFSSSYKIISCEAPWNGKAPVLRFKEGYYPASPHDRVLKIRQEAARILEDYFNIPIDSHHHEVATAGQSEINIMFNDIVRAADAVITLKYVVKSLAAKYGMVATFMPKPLYGDNGSGLHTNISLFSTSKGENLFYDPNDEYAELSQLGRYFIGGLLDHARALAAIVAPTVNSYKRLVPGYEAPVYMVWSRANRSACVRVPVYHRGDKNKRVEFRPPDPSSNPYLAFSAILAAGLDGIRRRIDPGDPIDEDVYKMGPERRAALGIKELPGSLKEAIEELESDNEFLRPIFPKELIETYIDMKKKEWIELNMYVTPAEIYKYIDI